LTISNSSPQFWAHEKALGVLFFLFLIKKWIYKQIYHTFHKKNITSFIFNKKTPNTSTFKTELIIYIRLNNNILSHWRVEELMTRLIGTLTLYNNLSITRWHTRVYVCAHAWTTRACTLIPEIGIKGVKVAEIWNLKDRKNNVFHLLIFMELHACILKNNWPPPIAFTCYEQLDRNREWKQTLKTTNEGRTELASHPTIKQLKRNRYIFWSVGSH